VKLLLRSTRRLALTPEGECYLQGARAILQDMQRFEEDLRAFGTEPSGTLRIGCGNVFGKHFLIPSLPAFLRQYPKVHVELR
jgi:DNA-binding transcriptional LysR family regulator